MDAGDAIAPVPEFVDGHAVEVAVVVLVNDEVSPAA
jgi:hypothetical protein